METENKTISGKLWEDDTAVYERKAVAKAEPPDKWNALMRDYSLDEINLLKGTIAKGTTDDELKLFLNVCKRTGLDPFARQIYCIMRKDRDQSKMSIQTSIDGFRLIAERTRCYAPSEEPPFFVYKQDGTLESATVYIYKKVDDEWRKCAGIAYWDEYVQSTSYGVGQMWKKMPRTMLAKCAEALILRKAFPVELSGLYTSDEMSQADNVIDQPKKHTPITMNKKRLITNDERIIITDLWKQSGLSKEWMIAWLANYSADKVTDLDYEQANNLKADLNSVIKKNALIDADEALLTETIKEDGVEINE